MKNWIKANMPVVMRRKTLEAYKNKWWHCCVYSTDYNLEMWRNIENNTWDKVLVGNMIKYHEMVQGQLDQ